jgi:hypothetical protein
MNKTDTPRTDALASSSFINDYGASITFARTLERDLFAAQERIKRLEGALTKISFAKPDQLDHAIDVGIIERAANIARSALKETQP